MSIYKHDEFTYFIEEKTNELDKSGKSLTRKLTVPFEDIDSLDLEMRGEQVPYSSKHVVNAPLYLLYYWSPIIGDRTCWLYLQLLTYCREDRDFLWDKLSELEYRVKMSRPTLNKHLSILEKYNFIVKIHRLNKLNNGRQTTPIIKVRQTIPLLSLDQYNKLSESSKDHHDKFMDRYGRHSSMDEVSYSSKDTMEDLLENSEVKVTQKMKEKVGQMMRDQKAINYIVTKLEFSENLKNKELHSLLKSDQSYFSKPAYETWMQDSLMFLSEDEKCVDLVVGEYAKYMFEDTGFGEAYGSKLRGVVKELYGIECGQGYNEIMYYTFEEYMNKLK